MTSRKTAEPMLLFPRGAPSLATFHYRNAYLISSGRKLAKKKKFKYGFTITIVKEEFHPKSVRLRTLCNVGTGTYDEQDA